MQIKQLPKSNFEEYVKNDIHGLRFLLRQFACELIICADSLEEAINKNKKVISTLREVRNATINLDKMSKLFRKKSVEYSKQYKKK